MRSINEIIVHCSATPEGKDFTVADITRWHKARGFRTIGYHFVIYRDGSIHTGRPLEQIGAHCLKHNAHSIGVCYIGGCATDGRTPKDTRTEAQKTALLELLNKLHAQFPNATIHGHRDFVAKACPSFDATKEYQELTNEASAEGAGSLCLARRKKANGQMAMAIILVFSCIFLSACKSTQKTLEEKVDSTRLETASTSTTSLATDKFLQSLVLNIDSIVLTSLSVSQVSENPKQRAQWQAGLNIAESRRICNNVETVGFTQFAGRTSDISDSQPCSGATLTSPSLPRNKSTLPPGIRTKVVIHGLRLQSDTADSSSVKTEVTNNNTQLSSYHSKTKAKDKKVPSIRWPLTFIAIAAIVIAALAYIIRKKMKSA